MISRHYATIKQFPGLENGNHFQLHYRESGAGTAIILLHPSPLSSQFMEPLIDHFSKQGRAIGLDTPGYGQSDPLPQAEEGLNGYVQALKAFIEALSLDRPVIYGSATGAQIAIEFAKAYPQLTRGMVLENVADFSEEEKASLLKDYFPSLEPRENGEHFQLSWQIASQLYRYFPWFDQRDETCVNTNAVPVELIHNTALHYLNAGPDYARAYRAAFDNEKLEQLLPVSVETRILHWQGGVVRRYTERLLHADLPQCIQVKTASADMEDRYKMLSDFLSELIE